MPTWMLNLWAGYQTHVVSPVYFNADVGQNTANTIKTIAYDLKIDALVGMGWYGCLNHVGSWPVRYWWRGSRTESKETLDSSQCWYCCLHCRLVPAELAGRLR